MVVTPTAVSVQQWNVDGTGLIQLDTLGTISLPVSTDGLPLLKIQRYQRFTVFNWPRVCQNLLRMLSAVHIFAFSGFSPFLISPDPLKFPYSLVSIH